MNAKEVKTYWVLIYISGPIENIQNVCRKLCFNIGLCVSVKPTRFIYTGGEETGAEIGLINYPRFPSDPSDIIDEARKLARQLVLETYQRSALIMSPEKTEWVTAYDE